MLKALSPEKICSGMSSFTGKRANHEHVWQSVGDYILPLFSDVQTQSAPGEAKYNNIYDSTAPMSLELLAGTLQTMLTSPSNYFFGLTTGIPEIDSIDAVRLWLQREMREMHDDLNNSNFQTEVHPMYLNLIGFGNAVMAMEEDDESVVRFATRPIREGYWRENSKGVIDDFRRPYKLSAKDIVEEFGEDNCPPKVLEASKKNPAQMFDIIHAIYQTPKQRGKKPGGFKFVSQYVLVSEKKDLKVEGFYEFPYLIPRWIKVAGEDYGRGQGEKALPETKTVNLMTEVTLMGAQKTIDPPLQMPDNGFVMPLITTPAGINYYRKGMQDRVEPIFNDARIDFGYQAIERAQMKIREAFYIDQLKLRDGPQMTAAEVYERSEQSLRFMGPMFGRLRYEFLDPLVARLHGIRRRKGLVAPMPEELRDRTIQIKFTSVMAMAQRQSELQNINRTLGAISPLASADPSILQNIHPDRSYKYIAQLCQLPQEMTRTSDELAELRNMMQKQAEEANANARAASEADSASKLVGAAAKVQTA